MNPKFKITACWYCYLQFANPKNYLLLLINTLLGPWLTAPPDGLGGLQSLGSSSTTRALLKRNDLLGPGNKTLRNYTEYTDKGGVQEVDEFTYAQNL
jgi:hypothetical protein